jgi:cationic peptide transport system permease protein
MIRYLIRRLYLYSITIILLLFLLFVISYQLPGSRYTILSGLNNITALQQTKLEALYQTDSNVFFEFIAFVGQRLNLEFGVSMISQNSITAELMQTIPASLELGLFAMFIALLFALPLGIISAISTDKTFKRSVIIVMLIGYSIPTFWFGILLSYNLGNTWNILPVAGRLNLLYNIETITGFLLIDTMLDQHYYKWDALLDVLNHMFLPTCTLAIYPFTIMLRITHSTFKEIMAENYIKAAYSRGLTSFQVIKNHAIQNAIAPILNNFSLLIGGFISYGIINEYIYGWPGFGQWLLNGIFQRDHTVILSGVLIISLTIITVSIVIDITTMLSNPVQRKKLYE